MTRPSPTRPGNDEAIEAIAAAWLAQQDEGLTPAESAEFARWQEADPRHAAAVTRLAGAWDSLQQLRDYRPEARVHPDRDLLLRRRAPDNVHPFLFRHIGTLAAAAAALAIAAVWWAARPIAPVDNLVHRAPVYATAADGYQRVVLEDGSVLELNANTAVRVEFAPAERHVKLLRGEAHFTVAKNKARPFIVEANQVSVRAVGTAFDVRLDQRDVEVLVTEGKVSIHDSMSPLANNAADGKTVETDAHVPLLVAGQRIVLVADGRKNAAAYVETIAPAVVRETLAWQGPRLRFVETPLEEVVAQFNRRNQIQLELADASLALLPVDGSFRAENVESFVRLLEANGEIRIERIAPNRIVLRRNP